MSHQYRRVSVKLFTDWRYNSFSDDAKYLFLRLICHPRMTSLGCMAGSTASIAAELGWTVDRTRGSMGDSIRHSMLVQSDIQCFIGLPNYLKHNIPNSPNQIAKAWIESQDLVPECLERNQFIQRAIDWIENEASDKFRKGLPKDTIPRLKNLICSIPDSIGDSTPNSTRGSMGDSTKGSMVDSMGDPETETETEFKKQEERTGSKQIERHQKRVRKATTNSHSKNSKYKTTSSEQKNEAPQPCNYSPQTHQKTSIDSENSTKVPPRENRGVLEPKNAKSTTWVPPKKGITYQVEISEIARIYQEATKSSSLIIPEGDDLTRCVQGYEKLGIAGCAMAIYGYVWQRTEQKQIFSGLRSVFPPVRNNNRTITNRLDMAKLQEFVDLGNESTKPNLDSLVIHRPRRTVERGVNIPGYKKRWKNLFLTGSKLADNEGLYGDAKTDYAKKYANDGLKRFFREEEKREAEEKRKADAERLPPEKIREGLKKIRALLDDGEWDTGEHPAGQSVS